MNKNAIVALASLAFVSMKAECRAVASTPSLQTIPFPEATSHCAVAATIPTDPGGKNGIYVPPVHRRFAGVPQHGTTNGQILVYGIQ
jgi:hypothetical protein